MILTLTNMHFWEQIPATLQSFHCGFFLFCFLLLCSSLQSNRRCQLAKHKSANLPLTSQPRQWCLMVSLRIWSCQIIEVRPIIFTWYQIQEVARPLIKSDFFSAGKYVVFFFYPLDFTFVCPTEIIAFSDAAEEFKKINCEVIGASVDSHFCHLAWWVCSVVFFFFFSDGRIQYARSNVCLDDSSQY